MNRNAFAQVVVALLAFASSFSGCVTDDAKKPLFSASRVVERMGGKSEAPPWADAAQAMAEERGQVVFISQMTLSGNSRSEACLKAAEIDGRQAMLRYIQESLSASGQINESDASSDPGYESLTAFLAQAKLSGVSTTARYWEKVEQSDEGGERVLKVRCAAKLAIKKAELERQLKKASAARGGDPEIHDSLLKAQKSFLDGLGDEQRTH